MEEKSPSEQDPALVNLFSTVIRKPSPKYDYSVVPSRVQNNEEDSSDEEETKPKKKKKPKSGLRGLRKKAEAEASGETNKGDVDASDTLQEELPEDPKETRGTKSMEILKQDRMKMVKYEDQKKSLRNPELEERTVYVGNLVKSFKKKQVKKLFSEVGKVESVRFRCAARPDMKTTKKEAVIKHKFHEDRSNIAAYVRFSTKDEAVAACALNGHEVEGHVIRVDLAMASKSFDNKKAVFLGNLDFKVEEEDVRKLFSKCGEIDNVRLVRDSSTGIGKGFGYVNFINAESVDFALRFVNQEICGRKVRVTRAVRKAKPGKIIAPNSGKVHKKNKNAKTSQGQTKRSKEFRKIKEAAKPFQGVSVTTDKLKKRSLNKTEKKNKMLAQKLSS